MIPLCTLKRNYLKSGVFFCNCTQRNSFCNRNTCCDYQSYFTIVQNVYLINCTLTFCWPPVLALSVDLLFSHFKETTISKVKCLVVFWQNHDTTYKWFAFIAHNLYCLNLLRLKNPISSTMENMLRVQKIYKTEH